MTQGARIGLGTERINGQLPVASVTAAFFGAVFLDAPIRVRLCPRAGTLLISAQARSLDYRKGANSAFHRKKKSTG